MENQVQKQENTEQLFDSKEFFRYYNDKPLGSSQQKLNDVKHGNLFNTKSIGSAQRSRMNGFR